jgi:hypothetical protein
LTDFFLQLNFLFKNGFGKLKSVFGKLKFWKFIRLARAFGEYSPSLSEAVTRLE